MRGRRENGSEFVQPAEVSRIERPGTPDVHVAHADGRQKPAARDQAHARGHSRRPDPGTMPHPQPSVAGIDCEQRRESLGERDDFRRDPALAYTVCAAGKDQLQLGGSRAITPEREHAPPGNLARYEDQLTVQHATARYRFSRPVGRNSPTVPHLIILIMSQALPGRRQATARSPLHRHSRTCPARK